VAWNVSNYDFLLNSKTTVGWSVYPDRHDFGDENQNDLFWLYDSDERNLPDSGVGDHGCALYRLADSSHAERQRRCHLLRNHGEHFFQQLYGQYASGKFPYGGWVFLSDVSDFYDSTLARSVS